MAGQTVYNTTPPIGFPGGLADGRTPDGVSKEAEVAIPFGRFVTQGTADKQCKLPTGAGDVSGAGALGVARKDSSQEYSAGGHPIAAEVNVLEEGNVYMDCITAADLTDTVYVVHAGANAGKVANAAGSGGDAATARPGMKFRTSLAAAGVVEVGVNLK